MVGSRVPSKVAREDSRVVLLVPTQLGDAFFGFSASDAGRGPIKISHIPTAGGRFRGLGFGQARPKFRQNQDRPEIVPQ